MQVHFVLGRRVLYVVPVQVLVFPGQGFLFVLFSDVVEPVLFMYEFLAAVVAADNRVVVHFSGVPYEVVVIFKFCVALVA